jgi:hypothetical protein
MLEPFLHFVVGGKSRLEEVEAEGGDQLQAREPCNCVTLAATLCRTLQCMGRHYCKMCCQSHALPAISRAGLEFDAAIVPSTSARCLQFEFLRGFAVLCSISVPVLYAQVLPLTHTHRAACLLADLSPGCCEEGASMELPAAAADFAEEHTIFQVVLHGEVKGIARRGFWSHVFRAKNGSGQQVVVKLYKEQQHVHHRQIVDRFHRELTALGTVGEAHSQGVCACLGFGFTADLWPYLVLEDAGVPLSVVRQTRRIAVETLAQQLLESMEHVHMLGISHNDLTEDNIVISVRANRGAQTTSGRNGEYKVPSSQRADHFLAKIVDWNSAEVGRVALNSCSRSAPAHPMQPDFPGKHSSYTPHVFVYMCVHAGV